MAAAVTPTIFLKKLGRVLIETREIIDWNTEVRRQVGNFQLLFNDSFDDEEIEETDIDERFIDSFIPLFPPGQLTKTLPREKVIAISEGTFIVKVSLNSRCWRTIQLSAQHTLLDLHDMIQLAFDFEDDHLYSFFMDGVKWSPNAITSPMDWEGPHVHEVEIRKLGLSIGQRFMYLFDYGDEWEFDIEVVDIMSDLPKAELDILESKGKSPVQYRW